MSNSFSGVQGAFKRDMRRQEKRHGLHGDYGYGSGVSMVCLWPGTAACAGALANIPDGHLLADYGPMPTAVTSLRSSLMPTVNDLDR